MNLKKKVPQIAAKYANAPYKLGGMSPSDGLDCVSYIFCFYRDLGMEIADHEGDLTPANYAEAWRKDVDGAKCALTRYLLSFGEEVDPKFIRTGDLALIRDQDGIKTAICLGNGNFLTCDQRVGTMIFPRRVMAGEIVKARRPCLKR